MAGVGKVMVAGAVSLLLSAGEALACPVCFGASDAPMAHGVNWGVFALLVVTVGVLGSFAAFFVYLIRRADAIASEPQAQVETPAREMYPARAIYPQYSQHGGRS